MARLVANVVVDGKWYGPAYPDAGDPPAGAVTNPAAYEDGKAPAAAKSEQPKAAAREGEIEQTTQDGEGVTREGGSLRGRRGSRR